MKLTTTNILLISLTIAVIVLIFMVRKHPIETNSKLKEYELREAVRNGELNNLRRVVDSLFQSIEQPKADTTIINENNTIYEKRANDIRVLNPNDKVRHLSEWLSKADSLR